jgi:hypothetical protein
MKLRYILFSVLVSLFILTIDVSAQTANGCQGGKRNGIYYTDCWLDTGDDTWRLQNAIDTIITTGVSNFTGSGKLIFNEGTYEITNQLALNSNLILEGTSASGGQTTTSSRINLTAAAGKSVFFINGSVNEVSIRDMGLSTTSSGTYGILAKNTNTQLSSAKFQFSNLRMEGFSKGIYVVPYTGDAFQFDNVRLDHATFVSCATAIEIDASDSGWHMTNLNILSGPNQDGVVIKRGGYISMNLIVGNGSTTSPSGQEPTQGLSGTFIKIVKSSNVSIQNSIPENYQKSLDIDFLPDLAKLTPIALINNAFGSAVSINNARVVSTGNFYGNNWRVALPVIKGKSDVMSIGDGFCYSPTFLPASQYCKDSKFVLQGSLATLQQMGGAEDPTVVDEKDSNGNPTAARPALKIMEPTPNKTLLELGNYNTGGEFVYRLKRDTQGRLSFTASQADPWKGYNFDGPIKLKSYTLGNLPTGVTTSGDLVFCTDCKVNTSPCQGAGPGALAVVVGSQWNCK